MSQELVKLSEGSAIFCYENVRDDILLVINRLIKIVRCLDRIITHFGYDTYSDGSMIKKLNLNNFEIEKKVGFPRSNLYISYNRKKERDWVISIWIIGDSFADLKSNSEIQISYFNKDIKWFNELEKEIKNIASFVKEKEAIFARNSAGVVRYCKRTMK